MVMTNLRARSLASVLVAALSVVSCKQSGGQPAPGGSGAGEGGSGASAGAGGNAGAGGAGGSGSGGAQGGAGASQGARDGGADAGDAGEGGGRSGEGGGGEAGTMQVEDASIDDASVDAGDASSPLDLDTGWSDACDGVTAVGHCVGDVFEWCDYFARGLRQLDCGALGMTCHAGLMPNIDDDGSGCVGDPCVREDEHCDGELVYQCRSGTTFVSTCERNRGAAATCTLYDNGSYLFPGCDHDELVPCGEPFTTWCDGTMRLTCSEEGLIANDCEAAQVGGRCVVVDDAYAHCDPLGF